MDRGKEYARQWPHPLEGLRLHGTGRRSAGPSPQDRVDTGRRGARARRGTAARAGEAEGRQHRTRHGRRALLCLRTRKRTIAEDRRTFGQLKAELGEMTRQPHHGESNQRVQGAASGDYAEDRREGEAAERRRGEMFTGVAPGGGARAHAGPDRPLARCGSAGAHQERAASPV